MGKLLEYARGITGEKSVWSRFGKWIVEVSKSVDTIVATPPTGVISFDSIEQPSDISTTSNVFSDMGAMSRTVQNLPDGGSIMFWFEATTFINNTGDVMEFRVLLDGVQVKKRGIGDGAAAAANSVAISGKTGALSAGSHTIKIQWANATNVNTLSCRPVASGFEGANLTVAALYPAS